MREYRPHNPDDTLLDKVWDNHNTVVACLLTPFVLFWYMVKFCVIVALCLIGFWWIFIDD